MVPLDDQIACVERELQMRRTVYGNRVSKNKMSVAQMNKEVGAMEAVLETLRAVKLQREPKLDL